MTRNMMMSSKISYKENNVLLDCATISNDNRTPVNIPLAAKSAVSLMPSKSEEVETAQVTVN